MFSYRDFLTESHMSISNVSCGCESCGRDSCACRYVGEPAWRRCTSAPTVSAWCWILVAGVCTDKCEAHDGHEEMRTPHGRPPIELWQLNCDDWEVGEKVCAGSACPFSEMQLDMGHEWPSVSSVEACSSMLPRFSCGAPSLARVVEWIIARPGESHNWRRTYGWLFAVCDPDSKCCLWGCYWLLVYDTSHIEYS